ncbi:hypothetical protein FG93_01584 [Bosea sp. LC85]|nr:hypothetical protein FG93_01584 [Bosea sp. LC85]
MICVTHDRVIFMASDEITEVAPPAEVFVAPLHESTRIFLGGIAPRHESKLRRFAIDVYPQDCGSWAPVTQPRRRIRPGTSLYSDIPTAYRDCDGSMT